MKTLFALIIVVVNLLESLNPTGFSLQGVSSLAEKELAKAVSEINQQAENIIIIAFQTIEIEASISEMELSSMIILMKARFVNFFSSEINPVENYKNDGVYFGMQEKVLLEPI